MTPKHKTFLKDTCLSFLLVCLICTYVCDLSHAINQAILIFFLCREERRERERVRERGGGGTEEEEEIKSSRVHTQHEAWHGARCHNLRWWSGPKSRIRHLTDWATHVSLCQTILSKLVRIYQAFSYYLINSVNR